MNMCSHGHDEIVHDSRVCPICEIDDAMECLHRDRKSIEKCTSHDGDPCWIQTNDGCPACANEETIEELRESVPDLLVCANDHGEVHYPSNVKCPACTILLDCAARIRSMEAELEKPRVEPPRRYGYEFL